MSSPIVVHMPDDGAPVYVRLEAVAYFRASIHWGYAENGASPPRSTVTRIALVGGGNLDVTESPDAVLQKILASRMLGFAEP